MWEYGGIAYRDASNGYMVLQNAQRASWGIAWFKDPIVEPFSVSFKYRAGGGERSGADGFVFLFYQKKIIANVGGLLLATNVLSNGYGVEFDNYQNWEINDPSGNHIALKDKFSRHLAYVNDLRTEDNLWHAVVINIGYSNVTISLDSEIVLTWSGELDRTNTYLGFAGACGEDTNWAIIDDVIISKYPFKVQKSIFKTLIFSDNFDDGVIDGSKWEVIGSAQEKNGYLTIKSDSQLRSKTSFSYDVILEFDMKAPNDVSEDNRLHFVGFSDEVEWNNIIFFDWNSPNVELISIGTKIEGWWSPHNDWLSCSDITQWQKYKIDRYYDLALFYQNDNLVLEKTNEIPNINLKLAFDAGSGYMFYIDDVKVYKIDYVDIRIPSIVIDLFDVSDSRCDIGSVQTVRLHAKWDNGTDVSNGLIYINGREYTTNSGGWIVFNDVSYSVIKKTWRVTAVDCSGVHDYTQVVASPSIIWDRINLTLDLGDDRIDVRTNAKPIWTAFYEYDGSLFQGRVNMKEPLSSQQVGQTTFTVESIQDDLYGLTSFTSNQVDLVWDRVKIIQGGVSGPTIRTGETGSVWFKAVYEYDNEEFTGDKGTLYVNHLPMTWSSFDYTWKYSTKLDEPGSLLFEVTDIVDRKYGLTSIIDTIGTQTLVWETPFIETSAGILSIAAALAVVTAGIIFYLRKRIG